MVDYAAEEISAEEYLFPGIDMSGNWKYRGFFCLFVLVLLLFLEIYFRHILGHKIA